MSAERIAHLNKRIEELEAQVDQMKSRASTAAAKFTRYSSYYAVDDTLATIAELRRELKELGQ